jgi:hypothetical protein
MGEMILQAYTCIDVSRDGEFFPEKILDKPVFILKFVQQTFYQQYGPNLQAVTETMALVLDKSGEIHFVRPNDLLVKTHIEEDKWQIPSANYPIS